MSPRLALSVTCRLAMIETGGETVFDTEACRPSFGVAFQVAASEYTGSKPEAGSRVNDPLRTPTRPTDAVSARSGLRFLV